MQHPVTERQSAILLATNNGRRLCGDNNIHSFRFVRIYQSGGSEGLYGVKEWEM